jgi:hypothetical protein
MAGRARCGGASGWSIGVRRTAHLRCQPVSAPRMRSPCAPPPTNRCYAAQAIAPQRRRITARPNVVQHTNTTTPSAVGDFVRLRPAADLPQRPRTTALPRVRIEGSRVLRVPMGRQQPPLGAQRPPATLLAGCRTGPSSSLPIVRFAATASATPLPASQAIAID